MSNVVADKAKYDELKAFIDSYAGVKGPLMPVMQKAQELFGALPFEVEEFISENLNIPMTDIYGVATFYAQFVLVPNGKYVISACMGTACYVKGAQNLLTELQDVVGVAPGKTTEDGLFTFNATRCLGCCGLAPVIMINDDVYSSMTPDRVAGIIEKYRA